LTNTATSTPSPTSTTTDTNTATLTSTYTATKTATNSSTTTATATNTASSSATPTPTASDTPTGTATNSATNTVTNTATATYTPTCDAVQSVVYNGPTDKVYYQSSSAAATPVGWQNPGFDTSSWIAASYVAGTFNPYNVSVKYSSNSTTGTSNGGDELLSVVNFNVPIGVFSATLDITAKGNLTLWLNGVLLSTGSNPYSGDLTVSVIPGGNNVLGIQVTGNGGTQIRYAYQLNVQGCQNYSAPMVSASRRSMIVSKGNNNQYPTPTMTLTPILTPTPTPECPLTVAAEPNLSKDGQPIRFLVNLRQASKIDLILFNIAGEKVYEEVVSGGSGQNNLNWDLKNQSGSQVASGLYIYVVASCDGSAAAIQRGKVLILH
jgi:hypothetical protein